MKKKKMQYIVLCLWFRDRDGARLYVQASSRRFETRAEAAAYAAGISPSLQPVIVRVPPIEIDEKGLSRVHAQADEGRLG